jgi:dipeptidyl aminopeptidase/acylaminoacyl peptidase
MADRPQPRITPAMCAYGRGLAEPRLSPDGERLAFLATFAGRGQLVVVPADGGPELVITSDPAPRPAAAYGGGVFDWTPDGESLVYAATDGGLWWVSAVGGPSRPVVTGTTSAPAAAPAVSPDGRWVAYTVDQHHVGMAAVDGSSWPVLLSAGADFCFDPAWSPTSTTVAWHEWDAPNMPWDSSRIAASSVESPGTVMLLAGRDGVQVQQPRFAPDGSGIAYLSDERGWLVLWVANPDGSGATPLVEDHHEHGDPSWGLGQRSYTWSPDGTKIAFNRNERGFGRLSMIDLVSGQVSEVGKAVHGGLSWAGDRIAAVRSGARTPNQLVVYRDGISTTVARGPVAGFELAELVEPEPVDWTAPDGATIHGRLYRPATSASGSDPPPMIVWIHGGPTSQWPVTFIPRIAYFVERGWAVLLPDHRGSTGWGRDYAQAMAGRWGDLDVSDTAAGMRAAADLGWADGRRMVPMGASAGGFTVLNLLAHHPELCAAGIDLFGVTDLHDLDETTHRFEAHYLHSVVGPLPDAADAYRERSPVTIADRITSPMLILHGDADVVVPVAQSRVIADRLRALGRTVELHVYEGEGHGWARPDTIIDELQRVESFLRRYVLLRRQR